MMLPALYSPLDASSELLVVLCAALCAAAGASALAAWLALARLKRMESQLVRLERLDDLVREVTRVAQGGGELDLRRLEHVLIDIRDGQRRVEDRLLAVVESSAGLQPGAGALALPGGGASALADRVVSRLIALGYERVQIVTQSADIGRMVEGDGDVLVEARRDGAPCKGRVSVRRGVLTEVQIQAAYSAFP